MDMDQRAVWGIRMGRPNAGDPGNSLQQAENLQRQGYVALGWPDIGDLSERAENRDALRERFLASYGESVSPSIVSASVGMLFRFVRVLQLGDVIVAPSPLGRIVRVGRITGPYEYLPSLLDDFPNVRSVEWRSEIAQEELGQEAQLSLRARRSLFRILSGESEFRSLASAPLR